MMSQDSVFQLLNFRTYGPRARRRSLAATMATPRSLGGEIALGAIYPTIEWILQQHLSSLEDAVARQAGVLIETEMR